MYTRRVDRAVGRTFALGNGFAAAFGRHTLRTEPRIRGGGGENNVSGTIEFAAVLPTRLGSCLRARLLAMGMIVYL